MLILFALHSIVVLPKQDKYTIVGDLHVSATLNFCVSVPVFTSFLQGQWDDLSYILTANGLPSDTNPYLFNGDFVDRGHVS